MQISPNYSPWIWITAVFNVALHLAFFDNLEYHRDELLYFSLGGHPAAGYASVPPLVGWLAWLVRATFGSSVLAVKLLPALFSGAMVLLCAAIARELGGKSYAMFLAAIGMVVAPLALRVFFLFQPVFLDIFFWTLIFYWLIRFHNTSSDTYLYAFGLTFGLALLNKYLIALLAACLLLSWLLTNRAVLQRKALYLAALAGLVVFSPNIMWQFTHDFPVLQHMAALEGSQLVHVSRSDFLVEQLLFTFSVAPLVWIGLYFLFRKKNYRSLALAVVFVVTLLLVLRGKSYYTAGIYPTLLAAGAVWWEQFLNRTYARVLLPALMTLSILPLLPLGLPIYPVNGLISYFERLDRRYGIDVGRRFEDGTIHSLPQDYADMLGWEELTRLVDEAYQQTGEKEHVLIYCENYGQAGAVAVIGQKYGLPEPVSFHESFLYWAPQHLHREVKEFIYVNDELGEDIRQIFAEVREIGRIQHPHARERGTQVYLCRKPKIDLADYVRSKIAVITPF
jgi:hypothetical protein